MLHVLYKILQVITLAKYGHYAKFNIRNQLVTFDDWKTILIIMVSIMGILAISNIIGFLYSYFEDNKRTFRSFLASIPIWIGYIFINISLFLLVLSVGSIIGTMVLGLLFSLTYFILILAAAFINEEEDIGTFSGFLHIYGFFRQYAQKIKEYYFYLNNTKVNYKKFLKIKV
jgi:hypothetical protein